MLYVEILYRKNGEKNFTEKMGKKKSQSTNKNRNHQILLMRFYKVGHTLPFFGNLENFSVATSRVLLGDKWWIKRKRIHDICIDWPIKPMHLPI